MVGERAKPTEFKLEREEWQASFEEGYTKDLVAKVLNKSRGGHIIDNVILDTGDGLRLSCAAWVVREETERFFYEWMRSRAREWGTDEEGQFPKLEKVVADSEFQPKEVLSHVSKAIVEVLNRRRTDPTRRRDKLHVGLDQPISFTEMEKFFGKVKKGTAPGVSGVPVELWKEATAAVKAELLENLNTSLDTGQVPVMWLKRVIKPLAKTEAAVGLNDIRPITLLEVAQKILTGILTARISEVWNSEEILHPAQMAFLFGRGCYQALERWRGTMFDCEAQAEMEEEKECHWLFLDLAKAYDSVEYWALEDAMRALGVPKKILRLMATLDRGAEAKVMTGGR